MAQAGKRPHASGRHKARLPINKAYAAAKNAMDSVSIYTSGTRSSHSQAKAHQAAAKTVTARSIPCVNSG